MTTPLSVAKTEAKWWERLPENFHLQADSTELDAHHPLKVGATAAMDIAMRSVLSTIVATAMVRSLLIPKRMQAELEQMYVHEKLADAGDSEAVFQQPNCKVENLRPRIFGYRPSGVNYQLLRFDSRHEVLNPSLAKDYQVGRHNEHAYAQHWFHRDRQRPTLIMLHGFGMDGYWLNAQMFSLRWFYKHGYDVLLCTLPFHGYRIENFDWFSGYRMFAGGFPRFNEAMVHAIRDVRVFMDYLESRGVKHMGVSGLSLGGYAAGLLACVEPRLAFCIPNSPVVSVIDIMREWQPTGVMLETAMRRSGCTIRDLRHALAVHGPLTYSPKITGDRVLIIGGAGDRFTPPRHVRLLHQHFEGSQLHWFPGNHLLHLHQGRYLHLMKAFMDRHCGLERTLSDSE